MEFTWVNNLPFTLSVTAPQQKHLTLTMLTELLDDRIGKLLPTNFSMGVSLVLLY